MKRFVVAMILVVACAPVASSPTPTPTSTATVAAIATASPTPVPTATVAPGLVRYVNSELGFSVDLPVGWRRATCSQGVRSISPLEAGEFFTAQPEAQEIIAGGARLVGVRVFDAAGLTPLAWLEREPSQSDTHFEPVTLNGRGGARGFIGSSGATYTFALAARGWIYAIEWPYFGGPDAELEAMISTLRILDDTTVGRGSVATPLPRSIESVADALADAFTRKDTGAIAGLLAPCVTVGGIPGDSLQRSGASYVTALGAEFAAGTAVRVQPRPIENDPYMGRFVRSTWSKPGESDQRVDLVLRADRDRWSVIAILTRGLGN